MALASALHAVQLHEQLPFLQWLLNVLLLLLRAALAFLSPLLRAALAFLLQAWLFL